MMSGEAGDSPGLDPALDRTPQERSRWGRRSPGRHQTAAHGSDRGGATYAALDLGTNNCRLLVARPTGDGFRVVDAFSRIVRLGEGVTASGRLSEAAIERALGALAICRNKMRNKGVTRARLIATEACRAAENGEDFRARVAEQARPRTGSDRPRDRGELAATGCTPLIDPQAEGVVLFDIGGGSSELVRLDRSQAMRRGPPLPQIARLDLAAARRGDAGRAPWRHRRVSRETYEAHGRRSRGTARAVRARARRRRCAASICSARPAR